MIDLHSHILYSLDDGAKNEADTLAMLHQAAEEGIHTLVATPHYIHGAIAITPANLRQRLFDVKNIAKQHGIPITLLAGNEISLDEYTADALAQELALPLNNSRYVLVELPFVGIPPHTAAILARIINSGWIPIIAHPERNSDVLKNPAVIDPFLQLGCLLQLNAASVNGHNGREAQDVAKDLLTTRRAHFIASDAHSPRSRPPKLAGARKQTALWIGETETARLFDTNPEAVLADEPLDVPQPLPRKQQPRGIINRILQHIAFY